MGELENLPDIMTVEELAKAIKVSEQTIWRHIKAGKLIAHKYGNAVRIEKTDLIKWRQAASK